MLAGVFLAFLALVPARSEAAPVSTVSVLLEPLGTLLPARSEPRPRASAPSCLLERTPKRACRFRPPEPGGLRIVPGRSRRSGNGDPLRYQVRVETGLSVDRRAVAAEIERILADPLGWRASGRVSFQRVATRPVDFRVVLAAPATVDRLCQPLRTAGVLSCATGSQAVLNVLRWRRGAPPFRGDVALYRRYLVNHEVGHLLGHGHASCHRAGARAPVMMQQTKGVGACRANGRPLPWERG